MVALEKIVFDVLLDGVSKVPLAQGNHSVETLDSNRADKPFCVGIQIRAAPRKQQLLRSEISGSGERRY